MSDVFAPPPEQSTDRRKPPLCKWWWIVWDEDGDSETVRCDLYRDHYGPHRDHSRHHEHPVVT